MRPFLDLPRPISSRHRCFASAYFQACRATVYPRTRDGRAAAAEQLRCRGVRARRRRRPAAIQDIVIGIVERERTRLLDSCLREYGVANISDRIAATPKILNLLIVFLRVSIGNLGPEAQGVTTEVSRNAARPTKLGFRKLN
jgi:hypothetical protein